MELKALFRDDRGVSPVIGVILMVAITVILAAVIGAFVLGLSDEMGDTSPRVSFGFDEATDGTVTVTHESGDRLDEVSLKYVNSTDVQKDEAWSGPITAGDSATTAEPVKDGTTLRIIWTGAEGDTATLGTFEA